MGCVGELDVVGLRPFAHLGALVRGEVVEHEREPDLGRVAGANGVAEGEELDAGLVLGDPAREHVRADVEGAEQVADAVRAGVGGTDPSRLRPWRPRPGHKERCRP